MRDIICLQCHRIVKREDSLLADGHGADVAAGRSAISVAMRVPWRLTLVVV